jgi:zinc transporter, ZIP family
LLASSALVLGGALGSYWQAPTRVTGNMLAFASGTLISALAFELFPEAVHLGGLAPAGWGLLPGAATFVVVNTWLDSRVAPPEEVEDHPAADHGRPRPAQDREPGRRRGGGHAGRRAREPGAGGVAGR